MQLIRMNSKFIFGILTLITLLKNGTSQVKYSKNNISASDGLINNEKNHPSEIVNFPSSKKSTMENRDENYRLPRTVLPYLYDISIFLTKDFAFRGLTKINATIASKTDEIVLHHGNIEIETVTITLDNRQVKSSHKYENVTEKLTIKLEVLLEKNDRILIAINYYGKVQDNLIGFYKSSYFNATDDLTYLFATQFQAVHARHAFPCFDEPSFKAQFKIKIRKNKKLKCLSNMRAISTNEGSGDTSDVFFKESIPMSTYLVAFVISDLESKGTEDFSVWARKEVINQADYALDIGRKSLKFFEKTFSQKYQIEKMDMVAIPDFAAGAMENWGLILYREALMLYHKNESSDVAQQKIAATIVHECAHMWFGNLVTPEWWGVLWLSEGFARYYEYMATEKIEAAWNMDLQFLVFQYQVALSADGLNSSAPLTRNISSQSEIGQSGDTITYSKGASILRMMELSFGSQIFNEALKNYLDSRKYDTAKPEELWTKVQEEVDSKKFVFKAPIETIMNSWTKQAGFPVVNVSINENKATLTQTRFLLRNPKSAINSTWWIPITWTTRSNPDFSKTVTKQWIFGNTTIDVELKQDDWIVFNIKSAGFFRLNYDNNFWYRIIKTLNNKTRIEEISVFNRAAIIDDLMNLARADYLDYNVALDGLQYLMSEMHYLPYKAALSALDYLTTRFLGQKEYDVYIEFILKLINKTHRKLGYDDQEGDKRLAILLRRELNELACRFNQEKCIKKSFEYFYKWRSGTLESIPKNRKLTVYTTAMKNATETDWDALWNRYVKLNVPTEQIEILTALGCNENATILERYLLWAVSSYEDHRIHKQDSATIFNAVSSCSLFGAEFVIDFIDKHHEKVIHYNGGSVDSISSILSAASKHFSTQQLIDKFEKLINSHKKEFESIISSLESQLELSKYELEWYNIHMPTIIGWINKFNRKDDTSATTDYFLPDSIVPTKYFIHVVPYIQENNFTFDGTVEIETKVKDLTDKIVLHVSDIEIDYRKISIWVNGTLVGVKSTKYSKTYQFLIIKLDDDLLEGTVLKIRIDFTGHLNNKMHGFYRSSYKDEEGNTRWLAATHLEPVGARKMFPCFDEPAIKAIFVISVTRPKSYHAISNMPLNSTINITDDLQKDTFLPTPPMSTYLVAVIVSQFANMSNKEHKVWTRPNVISQGNYSLSVMIPIIKFFEATLDYKYQLPKMDMVSVPDFPAGAMENWGLLTYGENRMLYDPNESSINDKQAICLVIAHEIAHQWFGDLVSPQWWKYLWLNEGFARYIQYAGCDDVHKSWKLPQQFVVDHLQTSFGTDGVSSSDPITHDVYSPSQISGRFNVISYAKAASILRTTEKILGSKIFFQSLHNYIKARQYDVATPDDLYKALQDQIDDKKISLGLGVKTFLDSWTLKAGFPVVSVKISGEKCTLSQERFLIRNDQNDPINQTWWVPITWTTQTENDFNNTVQRYWLSEASTEISLKKDPKDWIIFNIQETGYYRVNYDSENWLRIISALKIRKFDSIHEINRASIIDDLFNLGRTGYVTYDKVLSATQYLKNETNYLPWKAAFNGFSYLSKRFEGRDIYDIYRTHILSILQPIFEKLGFTEVNGEDHYETLLRILVADWACKFELPKCVSHSKKLFAEWKENNFKKVPVNQRKTVYCTAIKNGRDDDWDFLLEQYLKTNFVSESNLILQALGCSENPQILYKLLTKAITPGSEIRFQDSQKIFTYVYQASLKGLETVLEFINNNYDSMQKYYVEEKPIKTIFNGISQRLSTKKLLQKMQDIFGTRIDSSSSTISLKPYLTRAHYEFIWYDKYTPKIWEWLEKTYPSKNYRLPKIIEPLSYNIDLRPILKNETFFFDGNVTINMQVIQNTSRIILQANVWNIDKIRVFDNVGNELSYYSFLMNKATDRLSIYLTNTLGRGSKIVANVKYVGVLDDLMEGFYRSSYFDENGGKRWLFTTQLQPTHARKAFPCFDEPSFKAKFNVRIERPNGYFSRSNMPLKTSYELSEERTLDVFEESPLMSPYLVAVFISDFKSLSVNNNISIWTRPNAIESAKYSLIAATKLLKILENITGIAYCLPKLDLVAIPDFKAGAMENWGMVTFREYGLLYDDQVTQASYKRYINTTIAHELVHMWFGNLVTCDWWDYTWLNEGFAQYFSYVTTNEMEPSWNLLEQFVVYELHKGMAADDSEKSHPLNNNVSSPTEISSGFDNIAYKKGASLCRMMYHSFGPQIFINAIQAYLKDRQYKTAKPEHLWESIQAQTDKKSLFRNLNITVRDLMDSWTNQPGHPVVNVTLINGKMTLSQEQFLLSRNGTLPSSRIYWIPITYTQESNPNFKDTSPIIWFGNRSIVLDLDIKNEWFVLNLQEVGFYRVNYDPKLWYRLINLLVSDNSKYKIIHVVNRAQILNDVLNLAQSGYVSYTLALDATEYIINEDEHLPWKALLDKFSDFRTRFQGHKINELFARHIRRIVEKMYEKLGFIDLNGESQLDELNRELILDWACYYEYEDCVRKSKDLFSEWRKDSRKEISPNARTAVYCTALKHGNYEDWELLWNKYLTTNFASEKVVILKALGCTKNKTTLNSYLQIALDSKKIRRQDTNFAFSAVYNSGKIGLEACLEFLTENFNSIYSFFRDWNQVSAIYSDLAASISTSEQIGELEEFIKNNSAKLIEILPALHSALSTAKVNQKWFDTYSPEIYTWLERSFETCENGTKPIPTNEPDKPEITTNPGWTSTLPPDHDERHSEDNIRIHWILACIFLLLLLAGVIYRLSY